MLLIDSYSAFRYLLSASLALNMCERRPLWVETRYLYLIAELGEMEGDKGSEAAFITPRLSPPLLLKTSTRPFSLARAAAAQTAQAGTALDRRGRDK